MEISNPRRILAVSLEASTQQLSKVIKDLTGSHPEPVSSTLAGTTHDLPLKTPYYSAQVPIWLDLISAPSEWADTFLSDEAKEVLQVIGGIMVIFALPGSSAHPPSAPPNSGSSAPSPPSKEDTKVLISHVGRVVREGLGGWEWDGVSLGIGVGDLGTEDPDALDEWEDACAEAGLEFVHARTTLAKAADAKNEFGERTGIARALEALQSNDWDGAGAAGEADDDDFGLEELDQELAKMKAARGSAAGEEDDGELDPESLDFGFDRADFEGLKKAIWGVGQEDDDEPNSMDGPSHASKLAPGKFDEERGNELDDDEVQKLERMFVKLQAVRDQSAELPEEQRKKIAKRAVAEVMKEL
ncbi:hypothetical protein GQ53DRAFT_756494 [Thozetella sp. PMI_491]|nr:hypothetical protein GQ53DRAFT_756494 [Thozetella sp. PMI_491]